MTITPAIGIGLGLFAIASTIIIILSGQARAKQNRAQTGRYQSPQALLPTHHVSAQSQCSSNRRGNGLTRNSHANSNPSRQSHSYGDRPLPSPPPRAHVKPQSEERDPPPPYVA
jgi:hypothetical protein